MISSCLSRTQFDILVYMEKFRKKVSLDEISENTGINVAIVGKVLEELVESGYIRDGVISEQGILVLEPYRVRRAVIIAAGFGSRMVPITLNTPKPLVRVQGKRIIDGILDAILEAEIEDIIIVRGYLAEQFDQLLYKYPMIKFVENPFFNEANNISSAMCVRDQLKNAYIFEADILLKNHELVKKYQYSSNIMGIPVKSSDDWCLFTKDGYIQKQQVGAEIDGNEKKNNIGLYQQVGIFYWSETDGAKLTKHIEKVYNMPRGKERYWDQVPLVFFKDEYQIEVRECTFEDVVEIDTFSELKQLDKTYDV